MDRASFLSQFEDSSNQWDIVVIGGGATGMGVALDAAVRGYQVALIEQADFGEGTSSRSTKLIHGGVRYLRSGELTLVRESLRERGRLLKNAPNLVHPLAFVVPAYHWYERFYYGAGLTLYDVMSGNLGIGKTRHLSLEHIQEQVPNLNREELHGGTLYWDGQFDDARLIIALAKTAVHKGAMIANHVRAKEILKEDGKIIGVRARDQVNGGEFELRAKAVVNATGVFSDTIRKLDNQEADPVIAPSQGIHLVLESEFLGGDTGVMIPKTDDGRVLFAIPWLGRVLLGTTDTAGVNVSVNPKPHEEEVDYLLEHAERYLTRKPERKDICATFAGLRPLVRPTGSSKQETSRISRSHSIFVSRSGMITIAGGKWTTYRQMAEDTVDRIIEEGHVKSKPCGTADFPLFDRSEAGRLAEQDEKLRAELDPALPYTLADVAAAVRTEMAVTLEDVMHRRTRAAFLDEAATRRASGKVEAWMEKETGKSVPMLDSLK